MAFAVAPFLSLGLDYRQDWTGDEKDLLHWPASLPKLGDFEIRRAESVRTQ